MKRKDFLRKIMFVFPALLVPKISIVKTTGNINWHPMSLIPPKLHTAITSDIKLQNAIKQIAPSGLRIDIKHFSRTYKHFKNGKNI